MTKVKLQTGEAELQLVSLDVLDDHPKNPRFVREHVVDDLARQIGEKGFPEEHAILVRPKGDRFEIISGHHRRRAAERAEVASIHAWVREMDDDEAYMLLVLSNSQSELTPIEIGWHALHFVEPEVGGRGKKGGIKAYAEAIGKTRENVTLYRQAATVLKATETCTSMYRFKDKAQHLATIHSVKDRKLWPILVEALLEKGWSVDDTAKMVKDVSAFTEIIPGKWSSWFLPLPEVVKRRMADEFSPATVKRIVSAADALIGMIDSLKTKVGEYTTRARAWLKDRMGADAWDARLIDAFRVELEVEIRKVEATRRWLHGRWEDVLPEVDDGVFRVLLTDPPYGIEYQSGYRKEKHKPIEGDSGTAAANVYAMLAAVRPKLAEDAHVFVFCRWDNEHEVRMMLEENEYTVRGSIIWAKNNTSMGDLEGTFAPKHERIVHAVKGDPKLYYRESDVIQADRVPTGRHPTEKPTDLLEALLEATCAKGHVVCDPYGGVASTCEAAENTGCGYWSCELDRGYFDEGFLRLDSTA